MRVFSHLNLSTQPHKTFEHGAYLQAMDDRIELPISLHSSTSLDPSDIQPRSERS